MDNTNTEAWKLCRLCQLPLFVSNDLDDLGSAHVECVRFERRPKVELKLGTNTEARELQVAEKISITVSIHEANQVAAFAECACDRENYPDEECFVCATVRALAALPDPAADGTRDHAADGELLPN